MKRVFFISMAAALGAYFLSPMPGLGDSLPKRIERQRAKAVRTERQQGVLTQALAASAIRIRSISGELRSARTRLGRLEVELDRERARLLQVRQDLEAARDRSERLRARLALARRVLATRLTELYKADMPDALTVVLEADGFADLLDRAEFLDRLAAQDRGIFDRVRRLKRAAERETDRLAILEQRQQQTAEGILRRRDWLAQTRDRLSQGRADLVAVRGRRRRALVRVRSSHRRAQEDLVALEAEASRVRERLRAASLGAPAPGPVRRGSGRLIWPINGPITSPFGQRWGRLHAGLDIAAPEGTPIRAADSGQVVMAGPQGGYGLYTCIQHTAALTTCYAHQSRFGTGQGASVSQGQIIGYVGNTGNSFGAHLHFETRVGGNPVDPLGFL